MRHPTLRLSAAAALLALLGVGCAEPDPAPDVAPEPAVMPEPEPEAPPALELDLKAFDAEIEQLIADHALEGATAVVVHADAGVVHLRGYGAFDADRVSLIASASKVLTAGVAMRLHDEGVLDVDAPISTYVGDWGPRAHDPTLAQMLANSSGMVGLIDSPLFGPYICQYLEAGTLLGCGQKIYAANDAEHTVPPDTAFRYGGAQWQLAGAIAVHVTGRSWDALIDETYRTPCATSTLAYTNPYQQSVLTGGAQAATRYPPYFAGDLADLPVTDNPNMEGGAYATAAGYGQILLMHLRGGVCPGGRVLSEASVERMQRDRIADWGGEVEIEGYDAYGLGWWSRRDEPDVVLDPGSFGAVPWIDTARRYGAMVIVEDRLRVGIDAFHRLRPLVDAAIDGAVR